MSVSKPTNEPFVAYLYTTLAAHPGKVFRVRHEEVDPKTLAHAFTPTLEQVMTAHRSNPRLPWPRKEEPRVICNTSAPEPTIASPSPPKKTWWRAVIDFFDINSEIKKRR